MLNTETISQVIAVMVMIAPSASDNHVENYSRHAATVKTMTDCKVVVESFNQSEVQVQLVEHGPVTTAYAWCQPIYGEAVQMN